MEEGRKIIRVSKDCESAKFPRKIVNWKINLEELRDLDTRWEDCVGWTPTRVKTSETTRKGSKVQESILIISETLTENSSIRKHSVARCVSFSFELFVPLRFQLRVKRVGLNVAAICFHRVLWKITLLVYERQHKLINGAARDTKGAWTVNENLSANARVRCRVYSPRLGQKE